MIEKTNGSLPLWIFEKLNRCPGVLNFITSRHGGCSAPPFDSLNLGFSSVDCPEKVSQNREMLTAEVGVPKDSWIWARQVHGTDVGIIKTRVKEALPEAMDAMVTDRAGLCLTILVADCVPVLLCDPRQGVVAAVHAGWRGTAGLIVKKTADIMREGFGCLPQHIVAGIGPSIGPCCFEVGDEVAIVIAAAMNGRDGYLSRDPVSGKPFLDLWALNMQQLVDAGVEPDNIEVANMCTHDDPRFFSYRRSGGVTGRFGAGIALI